MYLGKRTALQRSGRHDWPAAGTFRASNPPKQAPPQVRPDDPGTPSPRAISSDWSRYIASRSDSPRQCWSTGISVQPVPTCCSAAFLAFGSRSWAPPPSPPRVGGTSSVSPLLFARSHWLAADAC
ncbi:hypothetical protein JX265_013538 [Neoarthrinium moseri]|uniref:Uncharacterized protein n=1 Tax=Neoarthrinium moseri TaxID=1658444 RepID=A0A9P9W8F5_9PEZI|nr:hypothetical protein JX265_013538 [Neoarthrinium moseri]